MPYNMELAERVRSVLSSLPGCVEKKMFGGVGFILRGNMACGVQGDNLIVRVGLENDQAALAKPNVRRFEGVPGKPMAGWVVVAPAGVPDVKSLKHWVELGYQEASRLPEKA